MKQSQKGTRLLIWSAAVLSVLAALSAAGQDLGAVAELPGAGTAAPQYVFARALRKGGPPFLVNVTPTSILTWPVGRASEPRISPLPEALFAYVMPAFADFDGDGNLDVAIVGKTQINLLKGDGAGRFTVGGVLPTGIQPYALAAGDFDGDGRIDLVARLSSPEGSTVPEVPLSVFLSAGVFRFESPRTTVVTPCCNVNTITAGDLDGDGRADLVVSSRQGSVSVWRSAGDGTFVLSQTLNAGSPDAALLADLDGDGLPEVIFHDFYRFPPFPVRVYKNDGAGRFHELRGVDTTEFGGSPLVVDMDGDGRPEIVFREHRRIRPIRLSSLAGSSGKS